ncbi:MAG: N-acetyltransferase family protein [Amaricoccus sp.]
MEVRPVRDADLPAVQAIYAHHVLHGLATFEEVPPDADELGRRRDEVLARGLPYIVAEEAGRLLGYAYAGPYRLRSAYRFAVEDSIYLDPGALGRGIGRALLERLIADSTAAGARQMLAVIGDSGNAASIAVHARTGFRHVGTFEAVGLKFGRWIDTVLMQRALGDGAGTLP